MRLKKYMDVLLCRELLYKGFLNEQNLFSEFRFYSFYKGTCLVRALNVVKPRSISFYGLMLLVRSLISFKGSYVKRGPRVTEETSGYYDFICEGSLKGLNFFFFIDLFLYYILPHFREQNRYIAFKPQGNLIFFQLGDFFSVFSIDEKLFKLKLDLQLVFNLQDKDSVVFFKSLGFFGNF